MRRSLMAAIVAVAMAVGTVAACAPAASSARAATGASPSSSGRTTSAAVSTAAGAGSTLDTLTVGGASFRYVLHVPAGLGTAKVPLVLNLHGSQGTAQREESLTGMDAVADQGKFIVAYPDEYSVKDVKALIRALIARGDVNPGKVFITGISRGGVYTELLGCKLAGEIAGIAAVAGPVATALESRCVPAKPLPVLLISGTADPIVPYDGGMVNPAAAASAGITLGSADVLSAPATLAYWRGKDGCTGSVTSVPLKLTGPADGTTTTVISGPACKDGTRVTLYRVNGGGHTWPGGGSAERTPVAARIVGTTSDNFSASQLIWDFFAAA